MIVSIVRIAAFFCVRSDVDSMRIVSGNETENAFACVFSQETETSHRLKDLVLISLQSSCAFVSWFSSCVSFFFSPFVAVGSSVPSCGRKEALVSGTMQSYFCRPICSLYAQSICRLCSTALCLEVGRLSFSSSPLSSEGGFHYFPAPLQTQSATLIL